MTNDQGAGAGIGQQPLPAEPSSKRILLAFLLCFTICAHRIYAGRYVSGVLQLAWVWGAMGWTWVAFKGLLATVNSSGQDVMALVQNVGDWEAAHGRAATLPAFVLIAVGLWVAVDAGLLLGGKFKDGQGRRMTRWW